MSVDNFSLAVARGNARVPDRNSIISPPPPAIANASDAACTLP
jgi:hypothetical protein